MNTHWIIFENHLALQDGKNIYHPTAAEIYSLSEDEGVINNIKCQSPKLSLPQVRFSGIGSTASIYLENDNDGNIYFYVYAIRKGKRIKVDIVDGKLIDQCVNDATWFYLIESTNSIQEILDKSNIQANGLITLKQYLKVIEHDVLSDVNLISNNIDSSTLNKPIVSEEEIPSTLEATLYPYQKFGYLWIKTMLETNNGCLLGDEMGLGKTMQVITELLYLKSQGIKPMLVIAPISLLVNWYRECQKFAPSLNVHIHHGHDRISNYRYFLNFDVIITAYSTVVSDIHMINMVEWQLVVLDEAQNIKNPSSSRTKMCKAINRNRSLAVSGTPFENHIIDIWSLIDFVLPGMLGSLKSYKESVSDDVEGGKKIEPILSALMVRRLVSEVAKDLPEKVVSTQPLQMSESESQKYCQYLKELEDTYDVENPNLGMLQKLRIFCAHPCAVFNENDDIDYAESSIKYQRLCEIVEEIISRNEKILVFTSYKRMFDIFKEDIPKRFGIKLWAINGETPIFERQQIVDEFNRIEKPVMLVLNPKAAGTGLNITGANHVIHYSLEWNPSLEDQATARAFRRGQQKTVFVYRLYYTNTVEQVINERIVRKRDISSVAIKGNDGKSQDREDIIKAIKLIPNFINKI